MLQREELLLIIYFIVVIVLLTTFAIVFFITFQKRKNKLLQDKFDAEKRFERELTQSQLEIQEQTLKNIGWELHDNIGQLLSVANMQLNILSGSLENESRTQVIDIKEIIANSLQEVRSLSKSLNNEVVNYAGLEASVHNELARFERLNIITTVLEITGDRYDISQKDAIILFRILQEFFSNVIKHSKAETLLVRFNYTPENLAILASDNGKGFDPESITKSSGLINMKSRSKLINTEFLLNSSENGGTSLSLKYPTSRIINE